MRCTFCKTLYCGPLVCLECNSGYCDYTCMQSDTTHRFQCNVTGPCVFCAQPNTIETGFKQDCGHGMHGSCALFCEVYGLIGCPSCPGKTAVQTASRKMMQEYARISLVSVKLNAARPPMPEFMMDFLLRGGDVGELLYMRGNVYANGLGVERNDEHARLLLTRAAALGHGQAMYAVSEGSPRKLKLAAERGSADACQEMGVATGDTEWFEKALVLSPFDSTVRFQLASCYVQTNRTDLAFPLLYALARRNHSHAILSLARAHLELAIKHPIELIKSLYWASRLSCSAALKIQGRIFVQLEQPEKAFECMSDSAASDDMAGIDSTYECARFHELGYGTPVNDLLAVELLEKAAKVGHASAQFDLAVRRFKSDRSGAMLLLRESAKTHSVAMHVLARLDEPDAETLLETSGQLIPSALYDLAVRKLADEKEDEAADLLRRALAMPEPAFQCCELDRKLAKKLLYRLESKPKVMDNLIRIAQFL